jgi:hypothetical protein
VFLQFDKEYLVLSLESIMPEINEYINIKKNQQSLIYQKFEQRQLWERERTNTANKKRLPTKYIGS